MNELWQPVPEYEGLYEVSNMGRVRSLDGYRWNGHTIHKFKGRLLRPLGKPYLHVCLSKDKKIKQIRIHQLVASVFLPECPGRPGRKRGEWHVDHKNDNKTDNRAENLQWLIHRDNTYVKTNRKRNEKGQFL
jgi:hypothetical protein